MAIPRIKTEYSWDVCLLYCPRSRVRLYRTMLPPAVIETIRLTPEPVGEAGDNWDTSSWRPPIAGLLTVHAMPHSATGTSEKEESECCPASWTTALRGGARLGVKRPKCDRGGITYPWHCPAIRGNKFRISIRIQANGVHRRIVTVQNVNPRWKSSHGWNTDQTRILQ